MNLLQLPSESNRGGPSHNSEARPAPGKSPPADPPPHDPLVCGLDGPGELPLCPGCLAELPARLAGEARAHRRNEARASRRRTRHQAEELAEILRDHRDLLRWLIGLVLLPALIDLAEARPGDLKDLLWAVLRRKEVGA